ITAALEDAGLSASDVDGLVKFTMETTVEVEIARNLGIPNLRFFGEVGYGGGAGCGAVGHAAMAIASGVANCVVVWRARNRGSGGRPWQQKSNKERGDFQWFLPWGLSRPVDQIAMLARRHMIEFGTTAEHLVMANYFNDNPLESPAKFAADALWRQAGLGPEDIDCAQFYDAFSPLVVMSLEEYGFVKPGEGGPFAADGELSVNGGS